MEEKKTFQKLREDMGFINAIKALIAKGVCLERLEEFPQTFEEWSCIHSELPDKTLLKEIAPKKMVELASTFVQWKIVWDAVQNRLGSPLQEKAIQKMVECAATTDECFQAAYVIPQGHPLIDEILKKIKIFSLSYAEWEHCFRRTFPHKTGEKIREISLQKMQELAQSTEEWAELYNLAPDDHSSKKYALQKLEEICKTWGQWLEIYCIGKKINKDKLLDLAEEKIKQYTLTFSEWEAVANASLSPLRIFAFEQMKKMAKTFDEWNVLLPFAYRSEQLPFTLAEIMQKLREFAATIEQWLVVYKNSSEVSFVPQKEIRAKIVALAETYEDWLKIFKGTPDTNILHQQALQELGRFIQL